MGREEKNMTEYETAIIALRETGNYIALGVGLLQAALIASGLWIMRKAATYRDKQHEETMTALHQQGEALHQQGEALRTLIARTAPPEK